MTNDNLRHNDTPLRDALMEALVQTPTNHIPKYKRKGYEFLVADASRIR